MNVFEKIQNELRLRIKAVKTQVAFAAETGVRQGQITKFINHIEDIKGMRLRTLCRLFKDVDIIFHSKNLSADPQNITSGDHSFKTVNNSVVHGYTIEKIMKALNEVEELTETQRWKIICRINASTSEIKS